MTNISAITDYELVDHGIDGAQYFQGCGVYGTSYSHVVTGCGDNAAEAIDDCIEQMAMDIPGIDWDAFSNQLLADAGLRRWPEIPSAYASARKASSHLTDEEFEAEECDVYYYVSIRYNLEADNDNN